MDQLALALCVVLGGKPVPEYFAARMPKRQIAGCGLVGPIVVALLAGSGADGAAVGGNGAARLVIQVRCLGDDLTLSRLN